jgi:hypothetical protein
MATEFEFNLTEERLDEVANLVFHYFLETNESAPKSLLRKLLKEVPRTEEGDAYIDNLYAELQMVLIPTYRKAQ